MTLDFSNPRDVVFYKDTIEFTVNDANFAYDGKRLVFCKSTKSVWVEGENETEPLTFIENPNELFARDDWKEYVSSEAVDIKPTKDNGFLMMKGTIRPKKDMVDQPSHYRRYGMESIDAMKGTMSPEEFNGFLKGNAFKYLMRAGAKDSLEQDLHKVCWYTMFLYLANGGTVEALGKTYEYMKERFAK